MLLGLREIRRARARFALLIGAVGLLVFLIFFQQTLLTNLLGFFTGALENQSGQVVVYGEDARKNLAGSVVTPEQLAAVAQVRGVGETGPLGEGTFTTRAGNGEEVDGILFGYRLGGPGEPTKVSSGRLPERDGEGVASAIDRDNGFDLGETIEIVPGIGGSEPLRIRIVGLADDSRFSVQPVVFVSFPTYEAARRVANPSAVDQPVFASAALAQPTGDIGASELARRIERAVPGVEALDRAAAVAASPGVQPVRQSFSIILFLAFLVVTLVTGFFFLILTVQKQAALTLLRAVGAPRSFLVRALLVQVVIVIVGGLLVGTALLALASTGSSTTFPIEIDPRLIATSGVVVLGLALISSLVAVRRVLRVDPADAVAKPVLGGLT
ncbi:MAG: ABC transporter permease [Acidimicrobiia bacterium]